MALHEVHTDYAESVSASEADLPASVALSEPAGNEPDPDRRHAAHVTGTRCDGDETGNRTGGCSQCRRVAAADPLEQEPAEHRGGCGHVGVDQCLRRNAVGGECRPGVEAEPAEPQDAGAEQ